MPRSGKVQKRVGCRPTAVASGPESRGTTRLRRCLLVALGITDHRRETLKPKENSTPGTPSTDGTSSRLDKDGEKRPPVRTLRAVSTASQTTVTRNSRRLVGCAHH